MRELTQKQKNIVHSLLILVLILVISPLVWAMAASFTPNEKVFQYAYPFSWRALIPVNFTLEAYQRLFAARDFGQVMGRTLLLSLATVFVSGAISFMAGFAFAQFQFRGKNILFMGVIFTFMVPVEVIIIPQYILMRDLGWLNTWRGLFTPGLANGLVIFLFRQFFAEIPPSILEAARVDGASWSRILGSIVLPISWPVSIGAGLVLFLATWNSFFWPLVVAPRPEFRVVQVAISLAVQEQQTFWNELFAGALLAAIIPIILVLPLQRFYVQSIATSGIKG